MTKTKYAASYIPIRLVALDLDGTAIRPDRTISRRTVRAVAAARRAGIRVVVATGRRPGAACAYAAELGAVGPIVTTDGALVLGADRHVVADWPIAPHDVLCLVERAQALGIAIAVQTERHVYWSRPRRTWELLRRAAKEGVLTRPNAVRHLEWDLVVPLRPWRTLDPSRERVYKVVPIGRPAQTDALRDEMVDLAVRPTVPPGGLFEIVAEEASKGRGLRALLRHLEISPESVLAMGDGHNDLEMFAMAAWPVAMGNAPEKVQAAARIVAPAAADDGVAQVLEALVGGQFDEWAKQHAQMRLASSYASWHVRT